MDAKDLLSLVHPAIAVAIVYPLIGMVVNMAWQTRQRRLKIASGEKSKIPPVVGREHVKIGRWLTGFVVGISLVALAYVIILKADLFSKEPFTIGFILLMFAATIGSLVCLYKADSKTWRGIFAALSSAGLIILGAQDGVFRRTNEWYMSHFYFGITVSILMIISLAILPEIYKDKSNRWRNAHIILNCLAILLFLGQGFTGARDLLEIPLSWQLQHLGLCDWGNQTCPEPQSQKPIDSLRASVISAPQIGGIDRVLKPENRQ
ncbi:MAG: DUF4079 domain-containing protein [Cyanobacteriota bacterium]|nr:DUF4079 domain-containing protein [Cyanobacteriota bacterium]